MCRAKVIQLSAGLLVIKGTLGSGPRLPFTSVCSVSGSMALRRWTEEQLGQRSQSFFLFTFTSTLRVLPPSSLHIPPVGGVRASQAFLACWPKHTQKSCFSCVNITINIKI